MLKSQYERQLPHWHPPGAALFLTARLVDSLPQQALQAWRQAANGGRMTPHQLQFAHYEQQLETGGLGPTWLRQQAVRELVLAGLQQQAASGCYSLLAACAMPNHLHVVLRLPAEPRESFYRVLQRYKSATAVLANRQLARTGAFWGRETYDHVVREHNAEALLRVVRYTALNPVKAGLCAVWQHWPGTYVAPEWHECF